MSSHAPHSRTSVHVNCPRCESFSVVALDSRVGTERSWRCPHCDQQVPNGGPLPEPEQPVEKCWICRGREFYLQKDFNRQLGVTIVMCSAVIIFIVMVKTNAFWGISLLFAVALIDWLIYHLLPTVSVCYLCQSIYRGFPVHPEHRGFYLGNEEKYKKVRRQWLQELGEAHPADAAEAGPDALA